MAFEPVETAILTGAGETKEARSMTGLP